MKAIHKLAVSAVSNNECFGDVPTLLFCECKCLLEAATTSGTWLTHNVRISHLEAGWDVLLGSRRVVLKLFFSSFIKINRDVLFLCNTGTKGKCFLTKRVGLCGALKTNVAGPFSPLIGGLTFLG